MTVLNQVYCNNSFFWESWVDSERTDIPKPELREAAARSSLTGQKLGTSLLSSSLRELPRGETISLYFDVFDLASSFFISFGWVF
ncbi:hypothetical protein [uncultured Gimesia sp.]|uniref:hypothetical protein n=1 Tax=uncultured Gimesia sp. TaxID=1678688 RepID=UPI00260D1221|nr:hypothetical protein [uncultured Gimesia sp.]